MQYSVRFISCFLVIGLSACNDDSKPATATNTAAVETPKPAEKLEVEIKNAHVQRGRWWPAIENLLNVKGALGTVAYSIVSGDAKFENNNGRNELIVASDGPVVVGVSDEGGRLAIARIYFYSPLELHRKVTASVPGRYNEINFSDVNFFEVKGGVPPFTFELRKLTSSGNLTSSIDKKTGELKAGTSEESIEVLVKDATNSVSNKIEMNVLPVPGKFDLNFGDRGSINQADEMTDELNVSPDEEFLYLVSHKLGDTSAKEAFIRRFNSKGQAEPFQNIDKGYIVISHDDREIDVDAFRVQTDGKLLVLARELDRENRSYTAVLYRFNADGSRDSSFCESGRCDIQLKSWFYEASLLLQEDGKILVAGEYFKPEPTPTGKVERSYAVRRFLPSGTMDQNFGVKGESIIPFPPGGSSAMTLQKAGDDFKILITGSLGANGKYGDESLHELRVAVLRLSSRGALDTNFGSNGVALFNVEHRPFDVDMLTYQRGQSIAGLADGRILLTAVVWEGGFLLRLTNDGKLDRSSRPYGGIEWLSPHAKSGGGSLSLNPLGDDRHLVTFDFNGDHADEATLGFLRNGAEDESDLGFAWSQLVANINQAKVYDARDSNREYSWRNLRLGKRNPVILKKTNRIIFPMAFGASAFWTPKNRAATKEN